MYKNDYYTTLGILPNAEDVVITAAYRALVGRYHPDRWKGDPQVAHERTAEINQAYAVLSDAKSRSEYDRSRQQSATSFVDDENQNEAFDEALSELEDRWSIALKIFPDLSKIRKRLEKTAHRLAFTYVVYLLDSQRFDERNKIASDLEQKFLEIYFGTNEKITKYAKELISFGFKDAIKGLNKLVDVLGSKTNPDLIVDHIEKEFQLESRRKKLLDNPSGLDRIQWLKLQLKDKNYPELAFEYARLIGYFIEHESGAFLRSDRYSIYDKDKSTELFCTDSSAKLCKWIREKLL